MAVMVRVRLMVMVDMKVIIAIYRYLFGEVCHCNSKRNIMLPYDLVVFSVSFAFGFHENCNNKQVKKHNDCAL